MFKKILLHSIIVLSILSCNTEKVLVNSTSESSDFLEFYEMPPTSIDSSEMIFVAVKNGKEGWMNVLGEWIIPPEYDLHSSLNWTSGLLICSKNGKFGVINYKNEVITPFDQSSKPHLRLDGIIELQRRKIDGYLEAAYISKNGRVLSDFGKFVEFRNGVAVRTSNRKHLGVYRRSDSDYSTEIYTSDFAIINTNFDTVLHIKNSPFLLEIGTLNNNRRSFVLHPYLGRHADRGISYGQYGYLDEKGEIVIEPQFNPAHALDQKRNGYDWNPNFPFVSNRSLVEKANDQYAYIDTNGNEIVNLNFIEAPITSASYFNNYGLTGVCSFNQESRTSKMHVIDTTGKVLFETLERDAYLGGNGVVMRSPWNRILPISDMKNQELRLYTPSFQHIHTFPKSDSLYRYTYHYWDLGTITGEEKFYLQQERNKIDRAKDRSSQKRIITSEGIPVTNWIDAKSILSHKFGVYSHLDTVTGINTLHDFQKNEIYSCSSCVFSEHYDQLENFGVFVVYNKELNAEVYINYKGTILSERFDSMSKTIVPLAPQVSAHDRNYEVKLNLSTSELFELFEHSEMFEKITLTNR